MLYKFYLFNGNKLKLVWRIIFTLFSDNIYTIKVNNSKYNGNLINLKKKQ